MPMPPALLDPVALIEDVPAEGLLRGEVGTVVEVLADGVYEVEFADGEGRAYRLAALRSDQLLPLRFAPARAA